MPNKKNRFKEVIKQRRLIVLLCLCAVYLALAICYSLMTPAWEANDESDHTIYIERVVAEHHPPRIGIQNGHESHQPPLYYMLLAGWQKILGIPAFQPDPKPAPNVPALGPNTHPILPLSHHYDATQKKEAQWLHELRLFSVLCGLGTVVFTFLAAHAITKRLDFSAAVAMFVVFLPKELVISSVVTNDSLVVALCAAIFYVTVKIFISNTEKLPLYCLALGLLGGAAVLTKLNSLPLVVLFFSALFIYLYRDKRRPFLKNASVTIIGFLLVSGWWFVYNWKVYGDPLAQTISNNYLIPAIPGLIKPVSWFDSQRYIHFLPSQLHTTAWYDAGWNQLILPMWMNTALWLLAFVSFAAAGIYAGKTFRTWKEPRKWQFIIAAVAVFSGLLTTYIIAHTTKQAEGRVAYIGLSAFAVFCVGGLAIVSRAVSPKLTRAGMFIWPVCLVLVNVYVITQILIPIHAL